MKLRQKQIDGVKYIEVTQDSKLVAYIHTDGEIVFKQPVYPLMAGDILTIAQNIHLFIDNIKSAE